MSPLLTLAGAAGIALIASSAFAESGEELRKACEDGAERCVTLLNQTVGKHAEKEICPPHGYQPGSLRGAFLEWAQASDRDLLARASSEQAAFLALKELFSCDE